MPVTKAIRLRYEHPDVFWFIVFIVVLCVGGFALVYNLITTRNERVAAFTERCVERGGVPLKNTRHISKTAEEINYYCIRKEAVIDVNE